MDRRKLRKIFRMITEKTTLKGTIFPPHVPFQDFWGVVCFIWKFFSIFSIFQKLYPQWISRSPNLNAIFRNTPKNVIDFHLLQSSTFIQDLFSWLFQHYLHCHHPSIWLVTNIQIISDDFFPSLTESKVSQSSTDSTCIRSAGTPVPCHHYG